MKIGLDARLITGRNTGDRTYWRGLIGGLAQIGGDDEFFLYVRKPVDPSDLPPLGPRFHIRVVPSIHERLWSLAAFPLAAERDRIDVAHVQYTVPPFMPAPTVTTIADISFKLFPHLFPRKDAFILGRSIPASIARAAAVIGVSENTRRDILANYPSAAPEKVFAVYNGVDPIYRQPTVAQAESYREFVKLRYTLSGPYLLCVGLLQPRKNVPLLLRAFQRAKSAAALPHVLVIAGRRGWLAEETEKLIEQAAGDVVFTGYIADEDLPKLYAAADALAYPSLYEGFGLPPAEAMACGCPVITSNTSSLPEVVGDAGILLDPTDEDAWTEGLARLLTDGALRKELGERAAVRAQRFSWITAAQQTLDVYREVYNHR